MDEMRQEEKGVKMEGKTGAECGRKKKWKRGGWLEEADTMRVKGEERQLKLQMSHRASQSMTAVSLCLGTLGTKSHKNQRRRQDFPRNTEQKLWLRAQK